MPQRIQRKRVKGWRKPENTVIVSRPSRFGNPFTISDCIESGFATSAEEARQVVTQQFRDWLAGETAWSRGRRDWVRDHLSDLKGRNLACWCPLPEPGQTDHCHAAVLLELAANTTKEN